MVDADDSPMLRRKRLGLLLRGCRQEAGKRIEDIAELLDCSTAKVSKLETAKAPPRSLDVKTILTFCEASDEVRAEAMELLRDIKQPTWWAPFSGVLPRKYTAYIGFEQAARALRIFDPQVVPGLLQTEAYACESIRRGLPNASGGDVADRVQVRMSRQAVLSRDPDPLHLTAILDEGVLHRVVGSKALMREQLQRLVDAAENEPNVSLRILPFAAGAPACATGGFTLLDFPAPTDPTSVHVETAAGDMYIERSNFVALYGSMFDELTADSLGRDATVVRIKEILSTYTT